MPKNRKALRELVSCRAKQMSALGIELENRVERILNDMQDKGLIAYFQRHKHFSCEDMRGKDFTVVKFVNGLKLERAFGVTISLRSCIKANGNHPAIPTYWFPPETTDESIQRRIMALFEDPRYGPILGGDDWAIAERSRK